MTLRERCDEFVDARQGFLCEDEDVMRIALEAFAREIRAGALEEAIEVAEKYDVVDANFSPYQVQTGICSDIRALVLLEKDSK